MKKEKVTIDSDIIDDLDISLKAKGLYIYTLRFTDENAIALSDLCNDLNLTPSQVSRLNNELLAHVNLFDKAICDDWK